jgi:hypothetical protein
MRAGADELYAWTVYDHPTDRPDEYVARLWRILPAPAAPTNRMLGCDDLEGLRAMILTDNPGLICLGRFEEDDPKIVEMWI